MGRLERPLRGGVRPVTLVGLDWTLRLRRKAAILVRVRLPPSLHDPSLRLIFGNESRSAPALVFGQGNGPSKHYLDF